MAIKINNVTVIDDSKKFIPSTIEAQSTVGTAGSVLSSTGSGLEWIPGSGGWNFISSVTANDSTSVAFTSGIDSTYDTYVVVGTGITAPYMEYNPPNNGVDAVVGDNVLVSRYSTDSGSSYISTEYNTGYMGDAFPFGSNIISGGVGATTNYADTNTCFTNWYFNLNSSTKAKICKSESVSVAGIGGTFVYIENWHTGLTTSSAVNAIEFLMFSGNISSGTFNLYGISNS